MLPDLGEGARLMVLGSRGRGGFGSRLLGSSGLACASRAACPVVVVPHAEPPVRDPYGQVVFGLSSAAPDDRATFFGFREAALRGARLRVVAQATTVAMAHLYPHMERFPRVQVQLVAAPGGAAGHLVAAARSADLVVVGRHRRRPLSARPGSVTTAVLLHSGCPVAVVPPADDGAAALR